MNTHGRQVVDDDPEWDRLGGQQCTAQHKLDVAIDDLMQFESQQK